MLKKRKFTFEKLLFLFKYERKGGPGSFLTLIMILDTTFTLNDFSLNVLKQFKCEQLVREVNKADMDNLS